MKYAKTFKCRKCGTIFEEIKALRTEDEALENLFEISKNNIDVLYEIHYCDNHDIGLADLIGFTAKEDQIKPDDTNTNCNCGTCYYWRNNCCTCHDHSFEDEQYHKYCNEHFVESSHFKYDNCDDDHLCHRKMQ